MIRPDFRRSSIKAGISSPNPSTEGPVSSARAQSRRGEGSRRDGWLVGSVDTVTRKLRELQEQLGGFGTLLALGMDYSERPEAWFESMRLLAEEVAPNVEAPAV